MYHKILSSDKGFSSQMEIRNDFFIVVLENKSKINDFDV